MMCLVCGDVIESVHRHDLKYCSCKNLMLDGGRDYQRIAAKPGTAVDLSIYNDQPYEMLRHHLYRIGYGKKGASDYGILRKTKFSEMSNAHLEASLVFPGVPPGSRHWQYLLEEKLYRAEKEIFIKDM